TIPFAHGRHDRRDGRHLVGRCGADPAPGLLARPDRRRAAARAGRADRGRRRRRAHAEHRLAAHTPGRGVVRVVLPLAAGGRAGTRVAAGRDLRLRREHGQRAGDLAGARLRRDPARGVGGGIVLAGWSAGMLCWFEAGVTDSFGPQLEGMRDGLGFLPGSACPHYDGEGERRPVYTRLIREGFPPGVAADDCVALRFDGTGLAETVTSRAGSRAYRVSAEGEEPIDARLLG